MNAHAKTAGKPAPGKPINICGIVVHLSPNGSGGTLELLAALPGVEIIGHADEGRVAITAIDTAETLAIDQLTAMHRLPGVVTASLAYHAFEGETPVSPASTPAFRA